MLRFLRQYGSILQRVLFRFFGVVNLRCVLTKPNFNTKKRLVKSNFCKTDRYTRKKYYRNGGKSPRFSFLCFAVCQGASKGAENFFDFFSESWFSPRLRLRFGVKSPPVWFRHRVNREAGNRAGIPAPFRAVVFFGVSLVTGGIDRPLYEKYEKQNRGFQVESGFPVQNRVFSRGNGPAGAGAGVSVLHLRPVQAGGV